MSRPQKNSNFRRHQKDARRFQRRPLGYEALEGRDLMAVISVTSLADNTTFDAKVTLREAILAANNDTSVDGSVAGSGADTIVFDPSLAGKTIHLSALGDTVFGNSALFVNSRITIDADSTDGITIDLDNSAPNMRLFYVTPNGDLTLRDMTLTGGRAIGNPGNDPGGGGAAGLGGAIANRGTLTIENSLLLDNLATGGNGGALAFPNTGLGENGGNGGYGSGGGAGEFNAVAGNGGTGGNGGFAGGGGGGGGSKFAAPGQGGLGGFGGGNGGTGTTNITGGGGGGAGLGGAIFNDNGTVKLTNTTLTGNQAVGGTSGGGGATNGQGLGGALFNRNGTVTILNTTITTNTANQGGGGIFNLADNSSASLSLVNTIVANAKNAAVDITATAINGGNNVTGGNHNIIESQVGFSGTTTITSDPRLDVLADNGGPTRTFALLGTSPATNAGTNIGAPVVDQRGFVRPVGGTTDIGAYENQNPSVTVNSSSVTVAEGDTATMTGTFADLDLNDNVTISASIGTIAPATTGSSGTWNWSFKTSDGPDDNQTVTIFAKDDVKGTSSVTFVLNVSNVAPAVILSGPTAANEGQTKHFTFTTSDPGNDTFTIVATSGGSVGTVSNVSLNATTGVGSFDVLFTDGPATSTVEVQVKDSDNALSNVSTVDVTVANVAPTVTLQGPNVAGDGQTKHYTFTTSDPGADTFVVDAVSGGSLGTVSNQQFDANTGAGSFDVTFGTGPATSTVSVRVKDSDASSSNLSTIDVTVGGTGNQAPTVSISNGTITVSEGAVATNSGSFGDLDLGDNVTVTASIGTIAPATSGNSGTWNWSLNTTDGPDQSQTVTITATDTAGASNTATFNLVVNNVAPTVTLSGPSSANEGQSKHYSFTVSDPGVDTFAIVSTLGGSVGTVSNIVFNSTTGVGSFDVTFSDGAATSTVSVQIKDSDDALSNISKVDVSVANVAPTVTLVGPSSASGGETKHFTWTTSDPGSDTFEFVASSGGSLGVVSNVQFTSGTGAGSFDVTFQNTSGTSTVSVRVRDSDLALSNSSSVDVVVTANAGQFPWHNSVLALDVNNDGLIAPIDVLVIVNELNRPFWSGAAGALPLPPPPGTIPLLDVNGDNFVSPIDAVLIINFINQPGNAEGEASDAFLPTDDVVTPMLTFDAGTDPHPEQVDNVTPSQVVDSQSKRETRSINALPPSGETVSSIDDWFAQFGEES